MNQFGRQLLLEQSPAADQVRIYHSRMLLSPKTEMPVIHGALSEVSGILFLAAQERLQDRVLAREEGMLNTLTGRPMGDRSGELREPLVDLIESIPGISFVLPRGYSIIVVKGRQWEWEEIEPGILRAFQAFALGTPGEEWAR
jgi:hypothetical protein